MKLTLSAAAALLVALLLSGTALAQGHRHTYSLYERDASSSRLNSQGCAAAHRGESGVVVLDFGKPSYSHHEYGTLDFSNSFISNREITLGMLGWAHGYVRCHIRGSNAFVTLARGTSNYHPSVPNTVAAGKHWAGAVLTLERLLNRERLSGYVRSAAADDAEPAWDSSFRQTRLFIYGFRRWAHGRTLYDYGSLDGGVGAVWSARQMLYVAGGTGHTAVLPEIYYSSQAQQWAQLAHIAHRWFHQRVHFAGVMTQGTADCDCGFRPVAAHRALVQALAQVDSGGGTRVPRVGTTIVSG